MPVCTCSVHEEGAALNGPAVSCEKKVTNGCICFAQLPGGVCPSETYKCFQPYVPPVSDCGNCCDSSCPEYGSGS